MTFRLAAIQPVSHSGDEEFRNLDDALDWMREAHRAGAELVLFPEGYPGPTNPAHQYDGLRPLQELARELQLHVVAGGLEQTPDGKHHVVLRLIDDGGDLFGTYRRTTPVGPYIYRDISAWDFDYAEASAAPQVFNTKLGKIGMLVCSEVYVPELSRVLALDGADLIVYPAGGAINELLATWRTMVWARAIENLAYTAAVQNLYEPGEQGIGLIASPEGVVSQDAGSGMLVADVDTERLRFLRDRDEHIEYPKPYATIPGVLRWRRPDLYGALGQHDSR
jgi:predicted amidohydrolase